MCLLLQLRWSGNRRVPRTERRPPALDLRALLGPNRLLGLWNLMAGYRMAYTMANLSLGVAAALKASTYLLLGYFVDSVLGQGRTEFPLPLIALAFVVLAAGEGGFTFWSGKLAASTAEGVAQRLRDYLYDHIQRLSFTYHDVTPTGDLIQRATSDVDALRRFFLEQAIGVGRIVFLFAINLVALWQIHPRLALVSVVVVPVVLAVSILFFRRVSKVYESAQEQEAKLSTTLQENLTGVRVVKAFARQDYESQKFEGDNWERYRRGVHFMTLHAFFWPISDVLCGFQMLAGFFVAGSMVINGELTVGTYMAYLGLIIWIIFPMRNLGRLIVQTSTGLVSYGRVYEVIRQEREPLDDGIDAGELPVRGEMAFRDVCFEYNAGTPVLRDVTFAIRPGGSVALLGSTGSGKTTLVNLLPRFYEYSGGSLTLDGVELNCYSRRYLRSQIGIVEQEPFLFSRSIRENISYGVGRPVTQREVEDAARAAAIHDVILGFPQGYDTLVGEKGVTLSGGQKQRVAIARTLLKDPRILILDDSTSAVDTETESLIRRALERLMEGRTTFLIAHRSQSAMNADLILVMERGHVVQQGTHAELLAQPGAYREIYELQAQGEVELERELNG